MRRLLLILLSAGWFGCAGGPEPEGQAGRVTIPSRFRPVPVHDLTAEWRKPLRRLVRGISLLPGLHREVVAVDPRVFVDPVRGDVLVFAPVQLADEMDPATRERFLRRCLTEVFGSGAPPEIVHTRSRGGWTRQYGEAAGGKAVLSKLGCLLVSQHDRLAWFVVGQWRLGGPEPFRMDHVLNAVAGQLEAGAR